MLVSMPQRISLAGLCGSACLLLTLVGCQKQTAQLIAPPPPQITVSLPVQRQVLDFDSYTGRVEAQESVEIRARVSGYLKKIHFTDGAMVEKDQLLFTIDPDPYEAEVRRAEGDLERVEALATRLNSDLKRYEKLAKDKVVSAQDLEKVAGDRAEAVAAMASAKASVEKAQLDLAFTQIRSPLKGRISRHMVSMGNLISAGGNSGAGTLLTTVVSVDPMHVYCDCSETNLLKYQKLSREGKRKSARVAKIPMYLGLANEEGATHPGYIDFVDNRVDPQTGTIRARGLFTNPQEYLTPGLFARIRVPSSGRYPALLIPERAIGTDQGIKLVMVVNAQQEVEARPVQLGTSHDGFRVVTSGLTTSDQVITRAIAKVRPGMKVTPKLETLQLPAGWTETSTTTQLTIEDETEAAESNATKKDSETPGSEPATSTNSPKPTPQTDPAESQAQPEAPEPKVSEPKVPEKLKESDREPTETKTPESDKTTPPPSAP